MKCPRLLALALPLFAAFALSGCMSVKDPSVGRHTGTVERSATTPPRILLVFQVPLEWERYSERTGKHIEIEYNLAGKAFIKRIEALGGTAEYKIHTDKSTPTLHVQGFTHVAVHQITQLIVTTSNGSVWNRTWDLSLYALDGIGGNKGPRMMFNQVYAADGVSCFSNSQYANREACQVKYIDHLVAQVAPIFPPR
jgi:hypothetical protein